ncbi:porin family protein [Winogradskyella aurantiaca]|uniref:porin family protein n=1 Tax=Winogradskyella aurantiaca TaxID=2219558 RepID=UPI000E1C9EE5|nr:porin family protein [Winogradskyella aurantiaca]
MVKSCFIAVLLLLSLSSINAQSSSGWGIKGGLNYGGSGNLVDNITQSINNPDSNLGWHLGVFGKFGNRFYLRPELIYTNLNSKYNSSKFKMQKLDLPVLGGLRVIGPLHAFIGPAFQYVINTDLQDFNLTDVENNFSVGFNVGVGVNLGNLGIDLRYERGFTANEVGIIGSVFDDLVQEVVGTIDTRPEQLILSVSFIIN